MTNADRWIWETPPAGPRARVEVRTIGRAKGTPGRGVIVGLQDDGWKWTWLDPSGKPLGTESSHTVDTQFVGDLDGDGQDEFLFEIGNNWVAWREGFREAIRLTITGEFDFLKDTPEIVRSPDGTRVAFFYLGKSFDLRTGKALARDIPWAQINQHRAFLLPDDPAQRPAVVSLAEMNFSGVRVASLSAPEGDRDSKPGVRSPDGPPGEDPRTLYLPPWVTLRLAIPVRLMEVARAAAICAVGLVPLGLAVGLLWWRGRSAKRSGIVTLMGAVAVAGLAFWEVGQVGDWVEYEDEYFAGYLQTWGPAWTVFSLLLVGLPLVALGTSLGLSLYRRRFLRAALWLAVAAGCAGLAAFVLIRRMPPPPGCRYEWTGLESLAALGLVAAGWICVGAMMCRGVVRGIRRLRARRMPGA